MSEEQRPLVSCVVPVFNGRRYLAATLDSIQHQSYTSVEVIVADDGSDDGSLDVAAAHSSKPRCVRQENSGAPSARNLGARLARGEFIAFLDADDLWLVQKLKRQMDCFRMSPALGSCTTMQRNFWEERTAADLGGPSWTRFTEDHPGVGSTLVVRRSVFETVGPFGDQYRHRDIQDWLARATGAGFSTHLLRESLVRRRLHDSNISYTKSTRAKEELLMLAQDALARRRVGAG